MDNKLEKNKLKPLIKEVIREMIMDKNEEIKELINDAIEDIAIANAVKEGRKGDYINEKRILKILEK
ncbi:MAG TPA: hypothetical protein PKD83_13065 [Ignavibacteria bacterium]|nr:hypothetical protein [Ignavibacteria bacterium]